MESIKSPEHSIATMYQQNQFYYTRLPSAILPDSPKRFASPNSVASTARERLQRSVSALRQLLALTAGLILAFSYAYAEQPAPAVEAVLLLDTSQSMKMTDPLALRIAATRLAISLLGSQDKLGIATFSNHARTLVAPMALAGNRELLLKEADKVDAEGSYTNFHEALKLGLRELSELPQHFPLSPRERAGVRVPAAAPMVILLTDGVMNTGSIDQDRQLKADIQATILPQYRSLGIPVHTIAFTPQADAQFLAEIAAATGGVFQIAATGNDLHQVITALFETVKQPDMLPISGDQFQVDAQVHEFTLVVEKTFPDENIYLQSPSGKRQDAASHGSNSAWLDTPLFSTITVTEPERGLWRIVSTAQGKRLFVLSDLRLMAKAAASPIAISQLATVETWLEEDADPVVTVEILKHLKVNAALSSPDKKIAMLPLNDKGEAGDRVPGDGLFTLRFVPELPGPYRLEIMAVAATFARNKVVTIDVKAPQTVAQKSLQAQATALSRVIAEQPVSPLASLPATPEPDNISSAIETSNENQKTIVAKGLLKINLVLSAVVLIAYLIYRAIKRT